MTSLPVFSATKIDTYQTCIDSYIARYLMRMPGVQTTYSLLGRALHTAIEHMYTTGEPGHFVFQDIINKDAQKASYGDVAGYSYSDLMRIGYSILDTFDPSLYTPMILHGAPVLEQSFWCKFPTKENPLCLLRGYIDMVTDDGRIVDFKSSSVKPSKNKVKKSVQLLIYAFAYADEFGKLPNAALIHHLRTNKQLHFDLSNYDHMISELEITIREMIALEKREPVRCLTCHLFCPMCYQKEAAIIA